MFVGVNSRVSCGACDEVGPPEQQMSEHLVKASQAAAENGAPRRETLKLRRPLIHIIIQKLARKSRSSGVRRRVKVGLSIMRN